jgi:hypothetical protein
MKYSSNDKPLTIERIVLGLTVILVGLSSFDYISWWYVGAPVVSAISGLWLYGKIKTGKR